MAKKEKVRKDNAHKVIRTETNKAKRMAKHAKRLIEQGKASKVVRGTARKMKRKGKKVKVQVQAVPTVLLNGVEMTAAKAAFLIRTGANKQGTTV